MTHLYLTILLGVPLLWLVSRHVGAPRVRQLLWLAASYGFYLTFGWEFFAILVASSLFNYYWGSVVRRRPVASVLWVGIIANVGLLSVFKYLPTLAAPFAAELPIADAVAHLALPIGISFWTFQALSYLFDQYRDEELDPTLVEFLLYMAFAPTVLSGPICRLGELLPQLRDDRRASREEMTLGIRSIWIGILMITLARLLGSGFSGDGVNRAFDRADALSGTDVWLVLVGYGFQLFFDFAGYSRVVIGIAQLFGVRLPENFRHPYLSSTPSEFWTRWHMSLSFWIRDYLFMPLATMRREVMWRNAMLVVSMVVFGLWHKASLLFVLWGTYQGLLLMAHRVVQQWQRRGGFRLPDRAGSVLSWVYTFAAINLGWILFRARDWDHAAALFRSALVPFGAGGSVLPASLYLLVLGVVGAYFALALLDERVPGEGTLLRLLPVELRYVCYAGIFYFAIFRAAEPQAFIYLQF